MIQKVTIFIATLLAFTVVTQAEQPKQTTENSDTVEAVVEESQKTIEEGNISETNASETITPITEKKQKPAM